MELPVLRDEQRRYYLKIEACYWSFASFTFCIRIFYFHFS